LSAGKVRTPNEIDILLFPLWQENSHIFPADYCRLPELTIRVLSPLVSSAEYGKRSPELRCLAHKYVQVFRSVLIVTVTWFRLVLGTQFYMAVCHLP